MITLVILLWMSSANLCPPRHVLKQFIELHVVSAAPQTGGGQQKSGGPKKIFSGASRRNLCPPTLNLLPTSLHNVWTENSVGRCLRSVLRGRKIASVHVHTQHYFRPCGRKISPSVIFGWVVDICKLKYCIIYVSSGKTGSYCVFFVNKYNNRVWKKRHSVGLWTFPGTPETTSSDSNKRSIKFRNSF